MSDVLTLGSLFSGIGGLELGLEWTGRFKTVWQVENNEYCRKVLAKHWPDVKRYEDVRNVGKENLERVDVICGGFPCQDISNAGRRAGIVEGNRSGLWHEYVRIVRELRPDYVVVENVSALLVRGLDIVLGELAESGYDAEWSMLSAADVGAPHLRQRIFVVAYAGSKRALVESQYFAGSRSAPISRRTSQRNAERRPKNAVNGGEDVAHSHRTRLEGHDEQCPAVATGTSYTDARPAYGASRRDWWSVEPAVGRVAHGVPHRVDRLRGLGNAVVPQCAQVIGEWLLEIHDELSAEVVA